MDHKKIEEATRLLLEAVGENPDREGLLDTPKRVARMYEEIFQGLTQTAEEHLSVTFEVSENTLVIENDIGFYSMCEHHLLPFYGKVHIAYMPKGRVAGLSKLVRTVDVYAKKPQLQERLTTEIADALMTYLKPQGCIVIAEAEHLCMNMRGVKRPGAITRTIAYRGIYEDPALRAWAVEMMRR